MCESSDNQVNENMKHEEKRQIAVELHRSPAATMIYLLDNWTCFRKTYIITAPTPITHQRFISDGLILIAFASIQLSHSNIWMNDLLL